MFSRWRYTDSLVARKAKYGDALIKFLSGNAKRDSLKQDRIDGRSKLGLDAVFV